MTLIIVSIAFLLVMIMMSITNPLNLARIQMSLKCFNLMMTMLMSCYHVILVMKINLIPVLVKMVIE